MSVGTAREAGALEAYADWQALGTQVRLVVTDPDQLTAGCPAAPG